MYKEINSRKTGGMGIIIAFVALVAALQFVLGILPVLQIIKDAAYMVALVAFVFLLIKRYLSSYEYELTEEQIVITTQLGGRERSRVEIEYSAIECFCPADDEKLKNYNARARMLCTQANDKYAMIFDTAEGKVKVIFAPSEHMVSLIENKLHSAAKEE